MSVERLGFGYNPGLGDADVAWGARLIIRQDGYVDFVPDRQDMIGTPERKQELLAWLNKYVKKHPEEELSAMLRNNELSTRENKEVVLYDDGKLIVLGNPNASGGYFYMVARWKDHD